MSTILFQTQRALPMVRVTGPDEPDGAEVMGVAFGASERAVIGDVADASGVVDVLLMKYPAGTAPPAPLLDVGDLPDEALAFVARLLRGDHDALLAVKAFTIMERRDADR